MDFITKCHEELRRNNKGYLLFQDNLYFSFENLRNLPRIIKDIPYIDELLITPYYLTNDSRLELYDYALMIRISSQIRSQEEIILKITGKDSIDKVDDLILSKLKNTQFEVYETDRDTLVDYLQKYIDFIRHNYDSMLVSCRNYIGKEEVGIYFEIA